MKKRMSRAALVLLLLCMVLCAAVLPQTAAVAEAAYVDAPITIGQGVTLDCFGWSFNSINDQFKDEVSALVFEESGYTSVLVSPVQPTSTVTKGLSFSNWQSMYDATAYSIDDSGNSALGTKSELEALCNTAATKGIKVLLQVVVSNDIITEDMEADVVAFLKECIDVGVDGFCFVDIDNVTVADGFWENVVSAAEAYASSTRGISLYCYAESENSTTMAELAELMSVAQPNWGRAMMNDVVVDENAAMFTDSYSVGNIPASRLVLSAESRWYYMHGYSEGISDEELLKAWALVASRSDAMKVFFARPDTAATLGTAAEGLWQNETVIQINRTVNFLRNQPENVYWVTAGTYNFVVVERLHGAIVVHITGMAQSFISRQTKMEDRAYLDQISGNTFTVSSVGFSGNVGSKGIALVCNMLANELCIHAEHDTDGHCPTCDSTVEHEYDGIECICGLRIPLEDRPNIVYYDNSATNWSQVYLYAWDDGGNPTLGYWHGVEMKLGDDGLYYYELPYYSTFIIFNDGSGTQTADLEYHCCSVYKSYPLDGSLTTEIIETRHRFDEKVQSEATKKSDGNCLGNESYWYTCAYHCAAISTTDSFEVPNTKTDHNLSYVEEDSPTCTENGTASHYKCGTCGKLFKDFEGLTETTLAELKLDGGHIDGDGNNVCDRCDTAAQASLSFQGGGETKIYYDIKEAFNEASKNSNVTNIAKLTVLCDIELAEAISIDEGYIEIYAGEYSLTATGESVLKIDGKARVTLKNGALKNGSGSVVSIMGNSSFNVNGGSISSDESYLFYVGGNGSVAISDGTMTSFDTNTFKVDGTYYSIVLSGGTYMGGFNVEKTGGGEYVPLDALSNGYVFQYTNGTAIDLYGYAGAVLVDLKVVPEIVEVDITWGSFEFTFDVGTWNPESLRYEGTGWFPAEEGGDEISVTNNGNSYVYVSVEYEAAVTGFDVKVLCSDGSLFTTVNIEPNTTQKAQLTICGSPVEAMDKMKLGSIRIILGGV